MLQLLARRDNIDDEYTASAVILHGMPTPWEICSICREVVGEAEIFHCECGGKAIDHFIAFPA